MSWNRLNQNNGNTLWMGDVEEVMDERFIRTSFHLMSQNPTHVKVVRHKTGQAIGYAFISFESQEMALRVLRELNGQQIPNAVQGKRFRLNLTSSRDREDNEFSIYVGDLSPEVDDFTLLNAFSKHYPSTCSAKVIVFWYYLLMGSKDKLMSNVWIASANVDLKKLLIASVMVAVGGGQEVVRVLNNNALNMKSKGKTREGVNDVLTQGDLASHRLMVHSLSAAFPGLRIISEEHSSVEDNTLEISALHVTDEMLDDERYSALPLGLEIPLGELTVWVDPLDATKEYSEGLTQYVTTMVCIARNGEPIIGVIHKPFSSQTYWSWKGNGLSNNIRTALKTISKTNDTFRAIVSRSHAGDVHEMITKSLSSEYNNIKVIPAAGSGYKTIELIEGRAEAYIHTTVIKKWDTCAPNALLNSIDNAMMTEMNGNIIKYNYEDEEINENGLLATVREDHEKLVKLFQNVKQ
ncbi:unnamed protein product [Medioppia subpectinata]|uniref:inositol-phosphate phosphatase n=1 Tax=Medioppia subpectinata TaxID=1979941 RepID=A0A7R9KU08_9ACAR|nr:unnamed protein product [Medioppia subpectinata]CAG2108648.1 unnamed protein product [Medioppia subpectinata]